ncbi:MAG: hypothetical protein MUP61_04615 [Burkholderiales bacterium]|nr:hypothetical protein [Burkholderiales bacterium]
MIDPDVRNAVFQLHQEGMSLREISRRLHVGRNAVRAIVKQQGKMARKQRHDKLQIDPELLERLYRECDGWIQRIHEKLVEEEGIQVGYSTLTRMLRDLGLSRSQPARCDRVPDEPGAEMQHDTTVYQLKLAGKRTKVIASLIYLRYSKRRYLRFYRVFNRFAMKCFLHEALMCWGYAARQCIIDNTNLARGHRAQHGRRRGETSGDRSRDECLLPALRLPVRLSRDRSSQSQGGQRTQFLDRGNKLPSRPDLRRLGRPHRASAAVGDRADGTAASDQVASDSGKGF